MQQPNLQLFEGLARWLSNRGKMQVLPLRREQPRILSRRDVAHLRPMGFFKGLNLFSRRFNCRILAILPFCIVRPRQQ